MWPAISVSDQFLQRFKIAVLWFVGVVVVISGIFGLGYWVALGHVAKTVTQQTEAAKHFDTAAKQADAAAQLTAKQAQTEHELGDRVTPQLAADTKRLAQTRARVGALKPPVNLPLTAETPLIVALQEENQAHEAVEADLRKKLTLKTLEADDWHRSRDQEHEAFVQERLHSLALDGVIAANAAQEKKDIFKAELKGGTIGIGIGLLGGAILFKK
jgi:hypothetical protein